MNSHAARRTAWDAGDRLALQVARAVWDPKIARHPLEVPDGRQRWTGDDVALLLRDQGVLGVADADWPILPLDRQQRADVRRAQVAERELVRRRIEAAVRIRDALAGADVPAIFFKGPFLSQQVWGRADARAAGDIDVRVPEGMLRNAVAALTDAGAVVLPEVADLRPRPLDRRMHHAICLLFEDTSVDVHYRMDSVAGVMAVPFAELLAQAQTVLLSSDGPDEPFLTLSELHTLMQVAANGGRDRWHKWGGLLEFVVLGARLPDSAALRAHMRRDGMAGRYQVALAASPLITGMPAAEVPATSKRLARKVLQRHVSGAGVGQWSPRSDWLESIAFVARSSGTPDSARWGAQVLVWPGDGVGRSARAGGRADAVTAARTARRRMMRALPRTTGPDYGGSLCPPDELCDLVDAEFATTNHSPIEPLFAGPASRAAAAHASVIAEVQRRCAERGIATTVVGDAAMADHYPAGLLRPVAQSRVLVRPTDDGAMRALRRTMTHLGALNSGAEWSFPTGDGGGADAGDVRIATALDPGATFAAATRAVWAQTHTEPGSAGGGWSRVASPELLLFASILQTLQFGSPAIRWYADAHAVGISGPAWIKVFYLARAHGWCGPVLSATAILRSHGWNIPPFDRGCTEEPADAYYWKWRSGQSSGVGPGLRGRLLLRVREAAHGE